jgi:hypothetical protein
MLAGPLLMINPLKRRRRKMIRRLNASTKGPGRPRKPGRPKKGPGRPRKPGRPKSISIAKRKPGRPSGKKSRFARPKKTVYGKIVGRRSRKNRLQVKTQHAGSLPKRKRLTRKRSLVSAYTSRKENPVKRVRRRRIRRTIRAGRKLNSWPGQPVRHSRAVKKGWNARVRGGRKVRGRWKPYLTRKGTPYKVPRRRPGSRTRKYPSWSAGTRGYRTWNAGAGIKDILVPALLGVAGIVAVSALAGKIPATIKDSLKVGDKDLSPVIIPAVIAASLLFASKRVKFLAKNSAYVNPIAFGMIMLAGLRGVQLAVSGTQLESVFQLSGYVTRPNMQSYRQLAGYRQTPMSSYRSLNSLGNMPTQIKQLPVGSPIEVDPMVPEGSNIPYGTGLSLRKRGYNKFDWQGVYDKAVYE